MPQYDVLENPLSKEEILKQAKENNGFVRGVISLDLSDIIGLDLEGFLNLISERLIGNELLEDAGYKIVGHDEQDGLHLEVTGLVDNILEEDLLD